MGSLSSVPEGACCSLHVQSSFRKMLLSSGLEEMDKEGKIWAGETENG